MNKRRFNQLAEHEQYNVVRDAARDVDAALNLFGEETIDQLMDAAYDARAAENLIDEVTAIGPHFSRSFVRKAMPACNRYLRYAQYFRENKKPGTQ